MLKKQTGQRAMLSDNSGLSCLCIQRIVMVYVQFCLRHECLLLILRDGNLFGVFCRAQVNIFFGC